MNASPFDYMANALGGHAVVRPSTDVRKTARLRAELAGGRKSAAELAGVIGVSSALVMPLLKNDLKAGRVRKVRDGETMFYELAPGHAEELERRLVEARRLLERNGFEVRQCGQEWAP